MKYIAAGKFKATCLKLMDETCQYHTEIIITKHGKPIAKLVPIDDEGPVNFYGCMKGTATINGNIISPIETEWDATK